ncbi:MAG: ABC transporter substrate-binding protein [Desulfotalea sp.]
MKQVLFIITAIFFGAVASMAEIATDMKHIILGQSAPFTGYASELGESMALGLRAAFAEINETGGIDNKKVILLSKDDGYEPYRTSTNTQEFINRHKIFALIGNAGTPTTEKIVPIITKLGVPLFAPFTGAKSLRDSANPYIINLRASYEDELKHIVDFLLKERGLIKISCFYQNDSYGKTNLIYLKKLLEKEGFELVSEGSYQRNTVAIHGALKKIHSSKPEAVIIIGSYLPSSEFITLSKIKFKSRALFCNLSFSGTQFLKDSLGKYGEGVFVSEVMPFIYGDSLLMNNFVIAMDNINASSNKNYISLEGYIAGRLFAEVCAQNKGPLTVDNFLETIQEVKTFKIDGQEFNLFDNEKESVYLVSIFPEIKKVTANDI